MTRVMAVDYGLKRIGIALTDPLQIIARPFDMIESVSLRKNALKIIELAKNNDVSTIVLGLPISMNGSKGTMVEIVYNLISEIQSLSNIEITTIDERLTTIQAKRILVDELNFSRGKIRLLKDKIAAALILQTYLNIKINVHGTK
ncbi:MAG: Holliday junction resolvase RuvX [Endomicrobium sp.]|nr:Holliday junction resolvase RuvX [Endomicrobium sp.]